MESTSAKAAGGLGDAGLPDPADLHHIKKQVAGANLDSLPDRLAVLGGQRDGCDRKQPAGFGDDSLQRRQSFAAELGDPR